jgi:uncharacterized protein YihD (DUF1040 family)
MHGCFRYPAMMVPQMQEVLISAVAEVQPKLKSIYEPFAGSGTIMTEAMKMGLNFYGQDINPLAVLLCRAKSGPFFEEAISHRITELMVFIKRDRSSKLEANFPGLKKWFSDDVAIELSKIRRAIRKEKYLWCRRFYWIALAEVVRLTSNSRTSTYKLYVRQAGEIRDRVLSPVQMFSDMLHQNLSRLCTQKKILQESGLIIKGRYKGEVIINLKDSSVSMTSRDTSPRYDLLVTSPPYGDNKTTISYGQYSFLPLRWIDFEDIDATLNESWLETIQVIDNRSLGGNRNEALEDAACLFDVSPSFTRIIKTLKSEPVDRKIRIAAFYRDLNRCIKPTLKALKPQAYMIWTVGNRCVAGRRVRMDKILSEMLIAEGCKLITSLRRSIPSKRMVAEANSTQTMNAETILVLRKGR